jgi:hypothetical protein
MRVLAVTVQCGEDGTWWVLFKEEKNIDFGYVFVVVGILRCASLLVLIGDISQFDTRTVKVTGERKGEKARRQKRRSGSVALFEPFFVGGPEADQPNISLSLSLLPYYPRLRTTSTPGSWPVFFFHGHRSATLTIGELRSPVQTFSDGPLCILTRGNVWMTKGTCTDAERERENVIYAS